MSMRRAWHGGPVAGFLLAIRHEASTGRNRNQRDKTNGSQ
jgi:hypothetical protein